MKIFILAFVAIIIVLGGYFAINRSGSGASPTPEPSPTPSTTVISEPTPAISIIENLPNIVKATVVTSKGSFELELYPKAAPLTVSNFIKLASTGFYDGTKFHRVIADFVVQGGDPLSRIDDPRVGRGGPGYTFKDEINPKSLGVPAETISKYEAEGYEYDYTLKSLPVDPGYVAMANSGPSTNGSQFFIVTTKPQAHLYGKHTVFAKVTKGMNVVLKIAQGDELKKVTINK